MRTAASQKAAILLSAGSPIALKVTYCLRSAGYDVHLLDLDRVSSARYSRYVASYQRVQGEPDDENSLSVAVNTTCLTRGLPKGTLVLPSDVSSVVALSKLREHLPEALVFPVSDATTIAQLDDKSLFQELLREHEIPGPRGMVIQNPGQLDELDAYGLAYPLVLKTCSGESGHGVFFVHSASEARSIASSLLGARTPRLVAQEYIDGVDADLSVLCERGKICTSVLQLRPTGDELLFSFSEQALSVGARLMQATEFTGVANIDLRLDRHSGEAFAIECNPRFWYTLQASLWRGLNFVEAGAQLALGESGDFSGHFAQTGGYHLHGHLLKRVIWNPRRWPTISRYNLSGLIQACSDPVPFIRG